VIQFFNFILRPFENGHAHAGLILVSIVTGTVMLFLFKLTSNQQAMKEVKTRISAYFLEMRLYKEDISVVMASQRRILRANMGYMKLAVIPALVMIVPVVLIMVQLSLRYGQVGFRPGDTVMVKVQAEDGVDVVRNRMTLKVGSGIEKASPAVRIPSLNETDWKIKLTDRGIHDLTLETATGDVTVPVYTTERLVPKYGTFKKASFWETIFNPGAPRIPEAVPIEAIKILYPEMSFSWGFITLSWLWSFLIISMAFGVILKFVFGVE
jgi:uncharacterized membrane protein (DUF106 family)